MRQWIERSRTWGCTVTTPRSKLSKSPRLVSSGVFVGKLEFALGCAPADHDPSDHGAPANGAIDHVRVRHAAIDRDPRKRRTAKLAGRESAAPHVPRRESVENSQ